MKITNTSNNLTCNDFVCIWWYVLWQRWSPELDWLIGNISRYPASSVKSLASTTQTFQPMASQVSKVLSPLQIGEQYEILPPPPEINICQPLLFRGLVSFHGSIGSSKKNKVFLVQRNRIFLKFLCSLAPPPFFPQISWGHPLFQVATCLHLPLTSHLPGSAIFVPSKWSFSYWQES